MRTSIHALLVTLFLAAAPATFAQNNIQPPNQNQDQIQDPIQTQLQTQLQIHQLQAQIQQQLQQQIQDGTLPATVEFRAFLSGYQEVPALSTRGNGDFVLRWNTQTNAITYELNYRDVESAVQAAHIHLGQPGVNGGVAITLCSNVAGAAGSPQACPTPSGSVTGTAQASDVVGPAEQGIAPGEQAELAAALLAGATYVNVHSQTFPNGEIRGQLFVQPVTTVR